MPTLTPILRSDTQGRMLAALYLHPSREYRATELAGEARVSLPTILRDIDRLVEAGFIKERTSGRNRYLSVNAEHPIFEAMATVIRYAYGPLAVLPSLLAGVPGIEEAHLFGSWAARYQGVTGSDPNDIDVVAIGNADRMRIYETAGEATAILGREVNIRAVSRDAWERHSDAFLTAVKDGPLVEISLGETAA
ncbi:winged helix-turn-helix domain-containing protein [Homoserinimonas aerilata]|uniref:winged helix-turn-helix domain-containing protein n=1 Tax=Homoserinimonas aerilata TaxID=1162970 RepID=UPI001150A108|nr:winged helix-turn-helix domain-containing protein [Homoserinimonas aerilata]